MVATPIPTIAVMTDESLTLSQRVEKWTWQLCRALEGDYEQYHRRMITNNSERYSGNREDLSDYACLLYTSPSPRDRTRSRMPSSA